MSDFFSFLKLNYLALYGYPLYGYNLFIHSSVNGHFIYFPLLTAMNLGVLASVSVVGWTHIHY